MRDKPLVPDPNQQQSPHPSSPGCADRPIRVLLWSPQGCGLHYSGAGISAYRLYSLDTRNRFEITLAHAQPQQAKHDLFIAQHHIGSQGSGPIRLIRFCHRARRWLEAHHQKFDIFHGLQAYHQAIYPATVAQRLGICAAVRVANAHGDLADKPGLRRLVGLTRRRRVMARTLSAMIALSQEIERELLDYGFDESRIVRIPNGVNADVFRPVADAGERRRMREQIGIPDRPTVGFFGSIVPRKRPHLLIDALNGLHQRGIEVQLVLAGPEHAPDYSRPMRRRIEELGLTPHVHWLGFNEEPAGVYRALDVFCLPSSNEGMSNALLEALSTGLPLVVTGTSGMEEVVGEDAGLQAEATGEALAEALWTYLSNRQRCEETGRAARDRALSHFSSRVVLDRHEQLFRRLMAGQTPRT
jgi:glycosyltransferase involved in cell wall biosynthesis